jgi:fructose/tagatose bisphosphate aldolase
LPLVLHGGSGIPNEQIRQAIKLGVCKMNIGTELLTAFTNELAQYFLKGKYKSAQGYDPRNYFPLGLSQTKKVVIAKIKLLGSFNKA